MEESTHTYLRPKANPLKAILAKKPVIFFTIVGLATIALLWLLLANMGKNNTNARDQRANNNQGVTTKTSQLNREFSFPIRDSKGETISSLKYIFESAELQNQIVYRERTLTPVNGKLFLSLNLKIVNESDKNVQIDTRDYVRLTTNGNEAEQLVANYHGDPLEVRAISTKRTRLIFVVNESDTNLKLNIGEIQGEKTPIDIAF